MPTSRTGIAFVALLVAAMATPATAGQYWAAADLWSWRAIHQQIYDAGNLIALLEANPRTDDGYKAPIITDVRADIWRLRATLYPAQWRWTTPCCYSRRPIHIAWRTHRRGAR